MTIEMMIEAHLVLNITTQRSSWLLADFSLFLEHDHGHHHDHDHHLIIIIMVIIMIIVISATSAPPGRD